MCSHDRTNDHPSRKSHDQQLLLGPLRRLDSSLRWFGFREVFHVLAVTVCAAHCPAISLVVYWPRRLKKSVLAGVDIG